MLGSNTSIPSISCLSKNLDKLSVMWLSRAATAVDDDASTPRCRLIHVGSINIDWMDGIDKRMVGDAVGAEGFAC